MPLPGKVFVSYKSDSNNRGMYQHVGIFTQLHPLRGKKAKLRHSDWHGLGKIEAKEIANKVAVKVNLELIHFGGGVMITRR